MHCHYPTQPPAEPATDYLIIIRLPPSRPARPATSLILSQDGKAVRLGVCALCRRSAVTTLHIIQHKPLTFQPDLPSLPLSLQTDLKMKDDGSQLDPQCHISI